MFLNVSLFPNAIRTIFGNFQLKKKKRFPPVMATSLGKGSAGILRSLLWE